MLFKTVLLSALLSGFPAALANPIGEAGALGFHQNVKYGNDKHDKNNKGGNDKNKGGNDKNKGGNDKNKGSKGNSRGNGHGNGHGNGGGSGNTIPDLNDYEDLGPWMSVKGFSRHWNETTREVELSFSIWDSRTNIESGCHLNAPIPEGVNYKFTEFHSLPCSKDDPPASQRYLISMGYVEYFDAGILNICDPNFLGSDVYQASAWFSYEGINRPRNFFRNHERVPLQWTDFGCVYSESPYPLKQAMEVLTDGNDHDDNDWNI